MQGFTNLAADFGQAIAVLIPLICYLGAGFFLLASGWGLWHLSKPGSFWERHPWVPFVTPLFAGILLSFDKFLNFGAATMGGGAQSSMDSSMTSYLPPTVDPSTLLGVTPEDTLLNIISMFIYFFRSYGALVVLLGVFSLKSVVEGNRKGATSLSIIMIGFGFCIMNVDSIAAAIVRTFT